MARPYPIVKRVRRHPDSILVQIKALYDSKERDAREEGARDTDTMRVEYPIGMDRDALRVRKGEILMQSTSVRRDVSGPYRVLSDLNGVVVPQSLPDDLVEAYLFAHYRFAGISDMNYDPRTDSKVGGLGTILAGRTSIETDGENPIETGDQIEVTIPRSMHTKAKSFISENFVPASKRRWQLRRVRPDSITDRFAHEMATYLENPQQYVVWMGGEGSEIAQQKEAMLLNWGQFAKMAMAVGIATALQSGDIKLTAPNGEAEPDDALLVLLAKFGIDARTRDVTTLDVMDESTRQAPSGMEQQFLRRIFAQPRDRDAQVFSAGPNTAGFLQEQTNAWRRAVSSTVQLGQAGLDQRVGRALSSSRDGEILDVLVCST